MGFGVRRLGTFQVKFRISDFEFRDWAPNGERCATPCDCHRRAPTADGLVLAFMMKFEIRNSQSEIFPV